MAHDLVLGQTKSNFSRGTSLMGGSAKDIADLQQAIDTAAASMQATTNNVYTAKNLNRITPASFTKFERLHDDFFRWKSTIKKLDVSASEKTRIIAEANDYRAAARAFQIGTIDPVVRNVLAKPADREYRQPPKVSPKASATQRAAATQTPQEAAEIKKIAATPIPPALLAAVAAAQQGRPAPSAQTSSTAARRPAAPAHKATVKKPVAKGQASRGSSADAQSASMVTTSSESPLETLKNLSTGKKLALAGSVIGLGVAGYMLTKGKSGTKAGSSRTSSSPAASHSGLRTPHLRPVTG